jgi:micrococcal nuclease
LLVVLLGLILNLARHPAVAAYRKLAHASYERRLSKWSARCTALQALVEEARTTNGLGGGPALLAREGLSAKLKRGEIVYRLLTGTMVEERSRQNVPTLIAVTSGAIAITSCRLLFEGGGKRREWAFDKLHSIRLVGADKTLLGVSNRKAMSGIQYGDIERTRMYLDLAIAEFGGNRTRVVAEMESRLAAHELKRPKESAAAESRKITVRERGVLLVCAALILWPVAPGLVRAFDPPTEPSWWWLGVALVAAAFAVKDLFTSGSASRRKRTTRSLLWRGSVVTITAASLVIGGGFAVPASALDGTVERVVDGDTIVVRVHGRDLHVRVLNIDTPETVHPTQADECLGQEASKYTEQLAPPGTRVNLKFDNERTDRYGRTLAVVTLSDGRIIASELAKAGLGIPMIVGGNDTYFDPVMAGFKQAEDNQRGYFDPAIECTYPAQEAQLSQDAAAAVAVDAGASAAEAAAAAATVFALYEAHRATTRLITTGTAFAIRAMYVVGATTTFAAYEEATRSLGETYRALESLAAKRKQKEDEAEAKRKAAKRAAIEAAAAAERAEERARRRAEQSSGDGNSSGSGGGGGGDGGYTGCRAYSPGGKTWKPIPCP